MLPVIALVGQPNVGKSTLFNVLTKTRDALVADFPGLTRDRQYGRGVVGGNYLVVDTGGLSGDANSIDGLMAQQVRVAIQEANIVLFMVDGKQGLTAADEMIATMLRQMGKLSLLVVNKTDAVDPDVARGDFYSLGFGEPVTIAASHQRGINVLMDEVMQQLAATMDIAADESDGPDNDSIKVAIVGRPNVGKSTLINRFMGEDRVVVFDMPGTTRDSIYIPFERDDQHYTLIDTAGVRRRARIKESIEKFSIIKTLQAIEDAHVVIMVLDAHEQISEQDAHLLGHAIQAGSALVLAINKWDGLDSHQRQQIKDQLSLKLPFVQYARFHFISALHGTGVGDLFGFIKQAYQSAMADLSTPKLTDMLQSITFAHQPPLVHGRRIKFRYAHQGGRNPPIIVIHGNQTDSVPESYKRYLENAFREQLNLFGTPIRIEFRTSDNPFAGKKNPLSQRQQRTRSRMMEHVKKREKQKKRRTGR